MPAMLVHLDRQRQTVLIGDGSFFKIDSQPIARMCSAAAEQIVDDRLRQADGQHAVLETVAVKNIGKAWSENRPQPVVGQRPRRVLAARPTAEVAPRKEDRRPRVLGPVQLELGIGRTVVEKSPIEKEEL